MRLKIFSLMFLAFVLTSCGAFKTIKEDKQKSSVVENKTTTRDSSNVVERNRPINDQVLIPISQSDDPEVNKKLDEVLSKLNQEKSSGQNGYKIVYDPELKNLLLEMKVAQTEDKFVSTNKEVNFEKSIENIIEKYTKKIRIPTWWIIVGLVVIFRKTIFKIILFFVPGLVQIKSFSDLFKKNA